MDEENAVVYCTVRNENFLTVQFFVAVKYDICYLI